jgi:hypothetical protein
MGNKSNKLYVIVDEEEGVILVNMDRTNPARPVVAATHTLAEMNNNIKIDSVKAVEFATEFNNHPNTNLRRFLVDFLNSVKFTPDSGLKYCIGIEQTQEEFGSSRRQVAYANIDPELEEIAGPHG